MPRRTVFRSSSLCRVFVDYYFCVDLEPWRGCLVSFSAATDAALLYYRTRGVFFLKQQPGHGRIESTRVYNQLVDFEPEDTLVQ